MQVQVALVVNDQVRLTDVTVNDGSVVADALKAAGVTPSAKHSIAIWNERSDVTAPLKEGDRVEVLPALKVDPMTARRLREARNQMRDRELVMGRNGGKHRLF